jgi:sorbitol-specific phosphotransferase system component IIBC
MQGTVRLVEDGEPAKQHARDLDMSRRPAHRHTTGYKMQPSDLTVIQLKYSCGCTLSIGVYPSEQVEIAVDLRQSGYASPMVRHN